MDKILSELQKIGLVPVVTIHRAEDAVPLAKALVAGGVPCVEVTFRTKAALEAIKRIKAEVPQMLIGAGTVLTIEQADTAIKAGASFLVSPGFNEKVVTHCITKGVPITPGCSTPSDVEKAIELGLEVVKFFPAEASGGLNMLKAMSAPYAQVLFMPTGGINQTNIQEYLKFPRILACGGSWMVKEELIEKGDFEEITRLTDLALRSMLNFQLAHIGINTDTNEEQAQTAKLIAQMFGFSVTKKPASIFAGNVVEVMDQNGRGKHGHIGFSCTSVLCAKRYLESKGFSFDDSTADYFKNGRLKLIYLKEEVSGFALHLVEEEKGGA